MGGCPVIAFQMENIVFSIAHPAKYILAFAVYAGRLDTVADIKKSVIVSFHGT
jgi:hypothetical protein